MLRTFLRILPRLLGGITRFDLDRDPFLTDASSSSGSTSLFD
ncbi:MAG: hypothetical protein JWN67_4418 [Actinomycetia bacterium]|nr:hypothetical protein [Actinomycetes bacterium]